MEGLDILLHNQNIRKNLGENGKRFVDANYL
jgi:hypothetical protein